MPDNALPLVVLLTDFGLSDHFVGVMKGVILGRCPSARIVDLCHQVPPQAIDEAAFLLGVSYRYFPAGAIFVVVVDPGVGSERRALGVQTEHYAFLAPDNGVLTSVLDREPPRLAVELNTRELCLPEVSSTFHGRDIFAPLAGHLAVGGELSDCGPVIDAESMLRRPFPESLCGAQEIEAQIIHVDRFGNLITNVSRERFDGWRGDCDSRSVTICAGAARIAGLSAQYTAVPLGQPLALFGSTGYLEIAVNSGNASKELALGKGSRITLVKSARD